MFFHTDGGNNHANFASSTVDGLLDNLSTAENPHSNSHITLRASFNIEMLMNVLVSEEFWGIKFKNYLLLVFFFFLFVLLFQFEISFWFGFFLVLGKFVL